MINSRNIDDLAPHVKLKALSHIAQCKKSGIDLLIYSTYRDNVAQDALYASGRTVKGVILTNARAGESWHNVRGAYDCAPLINGKCIWSQNNAADKALWLQVGTIGEACGLQWAGRWTGLLRETAHFQDTQGLTLAQVKATGWRTK
jgi:peptidoglycan LD-endopeptidase CwlK